MKSRIGLALVYLRASLVHRRLRPIHLIAGTQAGDQRPFRVTASG